MPSIVIFHFFNPGEQENIDKFTKRLVKVTKQHNDECKQLLTLMGVPYIEVSWGFAEPADLQWNELFFLQFNRKCGW